MTRSQALEKSCREGKRNRLRTWTLAFLCMVLASCLALPTPLAFAEVKKSDVISGTSVEERGLTVAQCPDIDSSYAIVMDADGDILYERNANMTSKIASITKVMTAIVSLEYGDANDQITVSEYAAEIGESSANLQTGDVLSRDTALKALMIPSGNDAAQALCEYYGQKMLAEQGVTGDDTAAMNAFVAAMNETAAKIGMSNSLFCNPHGLDDGEYEGDHHSTAHDVALMCAYAMQKSEFRSLVCNEEEVIKVKRGGEDVEITLESTDELLGSLDGACGIKTGYTNAAGACFAGCVNRNGKDLYTVVLGAPDESTRFTDTKLLVTWYYEHMIDFPLVNTTEYTTTSNGSVPVIATIAHNDYVDRTIKATYANPTQTLKVFNLDGNVSQKLEAKTITGNVQAGQVIGQVVYLQHNVEVYRVDLIAAEDCPAPNPLETLVTMGDRCIRSLTGQKTVATSKLVNKSTLINDKTSSL